ncbi:hypothetical protein HDU93_007670 [Gonapodya sp. JEL0774]|nr:hypothetical protein HDU93_007670 [Gonapodya sp. JEL0774]
MPVENCDTVTRLHSKNVSVPSSTAETLLLSQQTEEWTLSMQRDVLTDRIATDGNPKSLLYVVHEAARLVGGSKVRVSSGGLVLSRFSASPSATFCCSIPLDNLPKIPTSCAIRISPSGGVSILLENQIHLLGEDCSKHIASITLASPPDVANFSGSGRFLACADKSGALHFIHHESGTVVFSQRVITEDHAERLMIGPTGNVFDWIGFAAMEKTTAEELIVITADSVIRRFSNIDFSALEAALAGGDMEGAKHLKRSITLEIVPQSHHLWHSSALTVSTPKDLSLILTGTGDYVLSNSKLTHPPLITKGIEREALGCRISKVQHAMEGWGRCFILTDDGDIAVADPQTLEIYKFISFTVPVSDFRITSDDRIVALTIPIPAVDYARRLLVFHVTAGRLESDFEVSEHTWLAQTDHRTTSDHIPYVEADGTLDAPALALRSISQSSPSARIAALVQNCRFEEARDIASKFGFDEKEVLRSKLENVLENMVADPSEENLIAYNAPLLIADLSALGDQQLTVAFALKALLTTEDGIFQLLSYAREVIAAAQLEQDIGKVGAEDLHDIGAAMRLLGTLNLISDNPFTVENWRLCRDADLRSLLLECAESGNFEQVVIIWRRHHTEQDLLTGVCEILVALPETVHYGHLNAWLRDEVLPLLEDIEERYRVNSWLAHRARIVEELERRPHGALETIKLVDVNCSKNVELQGPATPFGFISGSIRAAKMTEWDALAGMDHERSETSSLKHQLEDLVYLWDKHDYQKTLAEYAFQFLDREPSAELLSIAFKKHVRPFAERKNLDCDDLLQEYCSELLERAKMRGTLSDAPWEGRVLAAIKLIGGVELKVDMLIEFMCLSPIPWSSGLDDLIRTVSATPGLKRGGDMLEQYRLMYLKKMLQKYGVKSFDASNLVLAKRVLHHILSFTDIREAMADALQVVAAYNHLERLDSYCIRARNLCDSGNIDHMVDLVTRGAEISSEEVSTSRSPSMLTETAKFTPGDAKWVGGQVVSWIVGELEDLRSSSSNDKLVSYQADRYHTLALAAVKLLVKMNELDMCKKQDNLIEDSYQEQCHQILSSLLGLSAEFSIYLAPDDIANEHTKGAILVPFANSMFDFDSNLKPSETYGKGKTSGNPPPAPLDNVSGSLFLRLGELLHFSRIFLQKTLAEYAARKGCISMAFGICGTSAVLENDEGSTEVLRSVAHALVTYAHSDIAKATRVTIILLPNTSFKIVELAVLNHIAESIDDLKLFEILHNVFCQTDAGDYRNFIHGDQDEALGHHGSVQETNGNGKSAATQDGTYSGLQLVAFLANSNSRVLGMRVWHCLFDRDSRLTGGIPEAEMYREEYDAVARGLLRRVLTSRNIDGQLALAYMLSTTIETGEQGSLTSATFRRAHSVLAVARTAFLEGLQATGNNYERLLRLSAVGQAAGAAWKQRSFVVDCQSHGTSARWLHQLRLLDIPLDTDLFRASRNTGFEYQRKLVPALLARTNFDVLTALEFARTYYIEDDYVLLEHIKGVLLNSRSYTNEVAGTIDDVANKDILVTMLMGPCFQRISPYDYEKKAKQRMVVVETLLGYKRVVQPTLHEVSTVEGIMSLSLFDVRSRSESKSLALLPIGDSQDLADEKDQTETMGLEYFIRPHDNQAVDNASTARTNIMKLTAATEIEYQLRTLNLEAFVEYVDRPLELVAHLINYESERDSNRGEPFDLHGLIVDICQANEIDREKALKELALKWLLKELPVPKEEKDLYLPSIRLQPSFISSRNAEHSQRIKVLLALRGFEVSKAISILQKIAVSSSSKISNTNRVRALGVLLLLPAEDHPQMATHEEMIACSKEALARSLWVNHGSNVKAVELICNLCIDYHIHDTVLWEKLLERLLRHKLHRYLLSLLHVITSISGLAYMRPLPRLWNSVLLGGLESFALRPGNPPELDILQRTIRLVQCCPFLHQLDRSAILVAFGRIVQKATGMANDEDKVGMMVVALEGCATVPKGDEEGVELLKEVMVHIADEDLVQVLNRVLDEEADSSVEGNYLNLLFDTLNARHHYEFLLRAPPKVRDGFFKRMAAVDGMDDLMTAVIASGWRNIAKELAATYFDVRVENRPDDYENAGKDDLLQQFQLPLPPEQRRKSSLSKMSINSAMFQNGALSLVFGEGVALHQDAVRLEVSGGADILCKDGSLILTNLRAVFLPHSKTTISNFVLPIPSIRQPKLVQPMFDANRFECMVIPVINGGLDAPATVKLVFKNGGAYDFHSTFSTLATQLEQNPAPQFEALPSYAPIDAPADQIAYPPPPPTYLSAETNPDSDSAGVGVTSSATATDGAMQTSGPQVYWAPTETSAMPPVQGQDGREVPKEAPPPYQD